MNQPEFFLSEEEGCRSSYWRNWLLSRANTLLNKAVLCTDFQVSLGRGRGCGIKCRLLFFFLLAFVSQNERPCEIDFSLYVPPHQFFRNYRASGSVVNELHD